jgi:hypothetical protein
MTVKPLDEHLRALAKKDNIGNMDKGRGGGWTPKRKERKDLTGQNGFESPAKRRKLSIEFNFEKIHTFWISKSKPSDANFRKNFRTENQIIAKPCHNQGQSTEFSKSESQDLDSEEI